jgi:sugar O-acyltransferase (sialic acid O-acetyltransferase NeuD family)
MRNIIFCGAGEFSREVFYWLKQSEKYQNIKFKGFLDFDSTLLNTYDLKEYYLGHEDDYNFDDNDYVIIPIAEPVLRERVFNKLKSKKVKFINYVHDSVNMGGKIIMGESNIICPNSILSTDIIIGDCNIFNLNVTIGHDVKIESFNTINSHCDLNGGCSIKNFNFLGSRVTLLPKSKIGNNNKIAAGSVVYKGIKNNLIFIGNPAKKIGINNQK